MVDSTRPLPAESDFSIKEKLLTEYYEEQLFDRTKQLLLYAGRVADAYEEVGLIFR